MQQCVEGRLAVHQASGFAVEQSEHREVEGGTA